MPLACITLSWWLFLLLTSPKDSPTLRILMPNHKCSSVIAVTPDLCPPETFLRNPAWNPQLCQLCVWLRPQTQGLWRSTHYPEEKGVRTGSGCWIVCWWRLTGEWEWRLPLLTVGSLPLGVSGYVCQSLMNNLWCICVYIYTYQHTDGSVSMQNSFSYTHPFPVWSSSWTICVFSAATFHNFSIFIPFLLFSITLIISILLNVK